MDLNAYSRDPNILFSIFKNKRSNINDDIVIEPQKNKYKNATLKINLSEQYPIGFQPYEILVDWYHCNIKLFYDLDDSLNNISCYDGPFKVYCCKKRPSEFYVREVFQFLSRGHSLHDPNCLCKYGYDYERALELGLSLSSHNQNCGNIIISNPICPIESFGRRQSLHDIALELGIDDIRGNIQVNANVKMPLLDALIKFGGMKLEDGNYLSSALCCIPHQINSVDDIIAAAKATSPKPFVWNYGEELNNEISEKMIHQASKNGITSSIYNNGHGNNVKCYSSIAKLKIKEELEIIQKKGILRMVQGKLPNTMSIFFSDSSLELRLLSKSIDIDIKRLWFKHRLVVNTSRNICNSSEYYLEKGPSHLDVEKMLISAGLKPTKTISKYENKKNTTKAQPKLSLNKIKHRSMFINNK